MIIFAGLWIVMLPYMEWVNAYRINRKLCLISGIYVCCVGVLDKVHLWYDYTPWLILLGFILSVVCLVHYIVVKIRSPKSCVDILSILIGCGFLVMGIAVVLLDVKDSGPFITSNVGAMIILSIPWYKIGERQ
jgi:uncharacterized membrane protein HdeD (DUF308 family)